MSSQASYIQNRGKISFTYMDSGLYGSFINISRLNAWRHAIISHNISTTSVIDLGCSYGSWASNYKELGFESAVGIDVNEDAVAVAKSRLADAIVGDSSLLRARFLGCSVVGCNGVIVHILEDDVEQRIFEDVFAGLKPGGFFVVALLNSDHYLTPSGFTPHVGPNSRTQRLEHHEAFLKSAGFRIVDKIGTFINPWFAEQTRFLAEIPEFKVNWRMFGGLIEMGAALRETGDARLFSEVLYVCQKPGG